MFTGSVFSPTYLNSIGVTDPAKASIALSAATVLTMLSSGAYSHVHRWFGTNRTFLLAMLCMGPGFLLCSVASTFLIFVVGLSAYGLGIGLAAPNVYIWAIENSDASPGQIASFVNIAFYFSPIFSPYIMSLMDVHHTPGRVFLIFGAAALFWAIWFGISSLRNTSRSRVPVATHSVH